MREYRLRVEAWEKGIRLAVNLNQFGSPAGQYFLKIAGTSPIHGVDDQFKVGAAQTSDINEPGNPVEIRRSEVRHHHQTLFFSVR